MGSAISSWLLGVSDAASGSVMVLADAEAEETLA